MRFLSTGIVIVLFYNFAPSICSLAGKKPPKSIEHHTKRILEREFKDDNVQFYLWNQFAERQQIGINNLGNLTNSKIKVLIHGYIDGSDGKYFSFYPPLVKKFLKLGFTIICVKWSYYAFDLYNISASRVNDLGNLIARLIVNIVDKIGIKYNDIHLIGHSLGAHAAGFAGKHIQNMTNGEKLGQCTGLDPAGPLFTTKSNDERLAPTDCKFVDTMIADRLLFGMGQNCGQVNFWVFCGINPNLFLIPFNHLLAPTYYQYSLDHELVGQQCSCALDIKNSYVCNTTSSNTLGLQTDFSKPGEYYITVSAIDALLDAGCTEYEIISQLTSCLTTDGVVL